MNWIKSAVICLSVFTPATMFANTELNQRFFDQIVAPAVEDNCSRCHSGIFPSGGLRLQTYEQIFDAKDRIFEVVSTGQMPPRNPSFQESDEATAVLYWIATQPEDDQGAE